MNEVTDDIKDFIKDFLSWEWTKAGMYWLIKSAGTMSELVFMIATLWVCVNAGAHTFILQFITEAATRNLTSLATVAYIALPVFIVGLAVITTISHIRTAFYAKSWMSAIWAVLFGVPTVIFLVLDIVTVGYSVTGTDFVLTPEMIRARALSAFLYAFFSLLYYYIGREQETDRLQEKDTIIEALKIQKDEEIKSLNSKNASLAADIATLKAEMERHKTVLEQTKNEKARLQSEMNKTDDMALQAYGQEVIDWLKIGSKTVNVDEIIRFTGHHKRRITSAITNGKLQAATRNKDLVLVSSLVEWLKTTPAPTSKADDRDTDNIIAFNQKETANA